MFGISNAGLQERNFKGTPSEEEVVRLEKRLWEATRMLVAHRIKVETGQEDRIHTSKEKLDKRLDQVSEAFSRKAGKYRFNRVTNQLEHYRKNQLKNYNIEV